MPLRSLVTFTLVLGLLSGCSGPPSDVPESAKLSEDVLKVMPVGTDVTTNAGRIDGESLGSDLYVFRGIPFAAAPTGDARWRAPLAVEEWDGARDAKSFGAICPQLPVLATMMGVELPATSEDCLFLNVWTPANMTDEKLPVMVWIHGGGLSLGWSNQSGYDGAALARKGVILVSVNYRLGPLGYLAHPNLTAESVNGGSGNYGFLDQIAALEWVQGNITQFGGDPSNVTIFGESAGGTSIVALQASPLTAGLFARAIAQSPWFQEANVLHQSEESRFAESAEARGRAWVNGIKRGATIADLRALPVEQLIGPDIAAHSPHVTVDGHFMKRTVEAVFAEGEQQNVPTIIGTNRDEGTMFMGGLLADDQLQSGIRTVYKDAAAGVIAVYVDGEGVDVPAAANQYLTDTMFLRSTREFLGGMGKVSSPAYQYHFTRVNPANPAAGAHHAAEIGYVFNAGLGFGGGGAAQPFRVSIDTVKLSEEDRRLREAMITYWTNFARTGNPNGEGLVEWPEYRADRAYLELGDSIEAGTALGAERLDRLTAAISSE
jgi:para-nitrobenzyl esterase